MTRPILTILLALTIAAGAAARTLEVKEGAYELALSDIILPRSETGTTFIKMCLTCRTIGLRVDDQTRYSVNRRRLSLREFREAVDDIRGRDGGNGSTYVGVFYDLQTTRVSKIEVIPRPD